MTDETEKSKKPYCGMNKHLAKGQRRATLEECVKKKQIRYYGIKHASRHDIKEIKKKLKEMAPAKREMSTRMLYVALSGLKIGIENATKLIAKLERMNANPKEIDKAKKLLADRLKLQEKYKKLYKKQREEDRAEEAKKKAEEDDKKAKKEAKKKSKDDTSVEQIKEIPKPYKNTKSIHSTIPKVKKRVVKGESTHRLSIPMNLPVSAPTINPITEPVSANPQPLPDNYIPPEPVKYEPPKVVMPDPSIPVEYPPRPSEVQMVKLDGTPVTKPSTAKPRGPRGPRGPYKSKHNPTGNPATTTKALKEAARKEAHKEATHKEASRESHSSGNIYDSVRFDETTGEPIDEPIDAFLGDGRRIRRKTQRKIRR